MRVMRIKRTVIPRVLFRRNLRASVRNGCDRRYPAISKILSNGHGPDMANLGRMTRGRPFHAGPLIRGGGRGGVVSEQIPIIVFYWPGRNSPKADIGPWSNSATVNFHRTRPTV